MDYALDLTRRHFVRPHIGKGITVYGTWYREGPARYRPCLALVPTMRRTRHDSVTPCVITVDDAHLWAEETGDPSYAADVIHYVFAERLNKETTSAQQCAEVLSTIHDEIGELMQIPPHPPGELVVAADGFVNASDGRKRHVEILDRE